MATFPLFRSKRTRVLLTALLLPLAGALPASAAVLFGVDLTGAVGDEDSQTFNNPSPQFISVTLSRVGLEAAPLTNGFGSVGWTTGTTPDYSKYLQIDIVPGAGVSYDITTINLKFALYSDYWMMRMASSIDNFATPQFFYDGSTSGVNDFVANPSGVSGQTGPISFRFYAMASSGFFPQSIGFVSASPAIEFAGSAVPEPTSAALLAGSLMMMMTFRRRR